MKTDTPRAGRRFRADGVTKLLFFSLFAALVLLPLFRMLTNLSRESFDKVFGSPVIGEILQNSLLSALAGTVISVLLAYLLACAMERTAIRGKAFFSVILVLPMLIPSVSHGMGLILLFGNNGILTRLLGLSSGIYGFPGIVCGSVLYAFPVAFIMLSDILRYEDGAPYEAATVLGIPRARQFFRISLPFLARPLVSVFFAVFTMILTDYGVPLMVGGQYKTLAIVMYQEVIGQLHFGEGSVYGLILLLPAVLAFLVDLFNRGAGNSAFVTRPPEPSRRPAPRILAGILVIAVSLFTLLPVVSFVILGFAESYPTDLSFSFTNLGKVFAADGGRYLVNSLVIAALTAALGTAIGFFTSYLTARSRSPLSSLLHLVAITAMAVPGLVLGLSYVLLYKASAVYGTLVILIMVNTAHFIASPYLMMYNSFCKLNGNLEAVGETLGVGRARMLFDVFLPQSAPTLLEMFSYFFVNSMMTISAVSFLANASTKPISLMINQFEAQAQLENAAVVSLLILLVNLALKGAVALLQPSFLKKRRQKTF